jgi:hypothetical protein
VVFISLLFGWLMWQLRVLSGGFWLRWLCVLLLV